MKGTGMKAAWDRLRSWKYASWVLYGTLLLLAGLTLKKKRLPDKLFS